MSGTQENQTSGVAPSVSLHTGTLKEKLTQKRLKEVLDYNPGTGVFTRKIDTGYRGCHKAGKIVGSKNKAGYLTIQVDGEVFYAHRLAWFYINGYIPENYIDHINRKKDDNRICNLRHVSLVCNSRNCGIGKNNSSGVTGVYWANGRNRWKSEIVINRVSFRLGSYLDKTEAVKARWEAEKKYGFPNCNTTSSAYQYLQKLNIK